MKRIALLHTVKGVLNTFEERLRGEIPGELLVHNLLDDFLASDANARGEFTIANRNRLFYDLKALELTAPDLIVATCSTLTPWVEKIRPFIGVPVVAIDDAMCALAVGLGERIHILASAPSTVEPTRQKLLREAAAAGRTVAVDATVCEPAFRALGRLDMTAHDQLLREAAAGITGADAVVLAQASMAHLEGEVGALCGCRALSSPSLCIAQVKELLMKGE